MQDMTLGMHDKMPMPVFTKKPSNTCLFCSLKVNEGQNPVMEAENTVGSGTQHGK
jgi:hypothetical protein